MTELLTIAEAAAALGVTPKSIRNYISRGDLTAYRMGGHLVRIKAADIDAMLEPIN